MRSPINQCFNSPGALKKINIHTLLPDWLRFQLPYPPIKFHRRIRMNREFLCTLYFHSQKTVIHQFFLMSNHQFYFKSSNPFTCIRDRLWILRSIYNFCSFNFPYETTMEFNRWIYNVIFTIQPSSTWMKSDNCILINFEIEIDLLAFNEKNLVGWNEFFSVRLQAYPENHKA